MSNRSFRIGIKALDDILGNILVPKTLMVIRGDTGTGKTILASTICYTNAVEGHRCLYISSIEDKARIYEKMKALGMNFEEIEKKGLIQFYKLPIAVKRDTLVKIAIDIHSLISEYNPGVVVFDSPTPLMRLIQDRASGRDVLEDLLNELFRGVDGLVVLIMGTDVYRGYFEGIDIEFLADIILTLKHEIKNNVLSRVIEITKARNARVGIAAIPFTIVDGRGIVAHEPIMLQEIPSLKPVEISIPCKILSDYIELLHKGQVVYITYPSDARPLPLIFIVFGTIVVNSLKSVFISYKYSPYEARDLVKRGFRSIGLDPGLVDKIIEKYFVLKGINPAASNEQQYIWEIEIIKTHRPDAVIFHGVDIVANIRDQYMYRLGLLNQIFQFKKMGILVIRLGSYDEKWYSWNATISDVVIRFELAGDRFGQPNYRVYIWRTGKPPMILDYKQLENCIYEIGNALKKYCQENL